MSSKNKIFLGLMNLILIIMLLSLVLPGFCALGQTTTESSEKVYNLTLQSFLGPGWKEWEVMLPKFVERVEKMSGGRIKIELYAPNTIVPTFECLNAVGEGVIDIAFTATIYWRGMFPSAELAWGVPFSLRTVDEYEYLWWGEDLRLIDIMREEYAKFNVFLIAPIFSDEWGATISTKPVKSLEDFKGMKIRTFGIWAEILASFGASVVSMPGAEIYTALGLGTLTGANWGSPYGFYVSKHHEVAKYYIGPSSINFDAEDIFINMDVWNSLPADLQEIIVCVSRQFANERASNSTWASTQAIEEMEKAGVTFMTLPDEDIEFLKEKSKELFEKRAQQDANCGKVADIIRKAMKYYDMRWERDPRIRH
ncbi:hypothetical protein ES705_40723 [subsurface metagenome]